MIGKIGRYELEALSGVGGMGAVYRAFDPQLKRRVAIKEVVSELLRDPRHLQRFQEEARHLARIGDPRVVTVHDFFQEGDKYYMVMEHVEGEPLSTFVKDPRLSPAEIHAILIDIASGLRAVHRLGIVHRDIKPKNVLFTPDRKVKIADFGIAKLMEKEPTIPEGTAKYLAPEVLEGSIVDGRTDIYSLGILAYELFLGDERFNALFPEVYGAGGDLDLKWKSWHLDRTKRLKPLNEYGVSISPWLAAVLARAVDKEAAARYQTIDEVLKDLEAARAAESPTRRFGTRLFPAAKPAGSGAAGAKASAFRRGAVAAAALLALGAGFAAVLLSRGPDAGGPPPIRQDEQALAHITRARQLLRENRHDEALAAVEAALKLIPNDPVARQLAADVESGRKAFVLAAGQTAEHRKWLELGRRRRAEGRFKEAEESFLKAMAVSPTEEARRELEETRAILARAAEAPPAADPDAGVLVLETQPPGARIEVDGTARGKTPARDLVLPPGLHRVKLSLRFHEDAEFAVDIPARDVVRKSVTLQTARGAIFVTTDPPGARLFLDHDWHAEPSPTKIEGVAAGQHFLWAEKEKEGLGLQQIVFVDSDETAAAHLKLLRQGRPAQVEARERERQSGAALDRAQAALAQKNWAAAAAALRQALQFHDAPEIRRKLAAVEAVHALEEAGALEAAGNFDGALSLLEPHRASADSPELRLALDRLRHKRDGLVSVPAGEFLLGSALPDEGDAPPAGAPRPLPPESDERPAQKAVLDAFLIDRTEVTNARYAAFLEDLRRTGDHSRCHPAEPKGKDHTPAGWKTPAYEEYSPTPDHPVVFVDWFDACAFAGWARMRLPTEAEWEKAAGHDPVSGVKRVFPWGDAWDPARCNAEWGLDGFERAAPAGRFPAGASPCGALDMAGNVWEWCADWYDHAYPPLGPEPRRNPTGPGAGEYRVVRGGSWIDGRASLRVANRLKDLPTYRSDKLGFRCVQSLKK